jgi:DNA end-binding protein Ku
MSTATAAPRRKPITRARTRKPDTASPAAATTAVADDGGGEEARNVSKRPRGRGAYRATKREAGEDYGAMGRPLWSGSISFGLVNIPVRLHAAVREQRVAFHMLHDHDKTRLRRRLVCPADGKEVHPEHVVRGYEYAKDQYVIVRDAELEGCAPEKTKTIEITDFVELAEIDPLFFDRPYYVIPQAGSSKPYRLLVDAMTRAKRVGLARIVMHEKEHLAALRPLGGLLCLETMHFADEVVSLDEVDDVPADMKFADKELKAAEHIIRELSGDFDPGDFRDEYRECVRTMVEQKAKGDGVVAAPRAEDEAEERKPARAATNLMAALEASLAQARKQSDAAASSPSPAKRRKSA